MRVLEAIKLFADVPGCVFVLGLDPEIIAKGVEIQYKTLFQSGREVTEQTINGARYLEKIIQLPFIIPPVEHADIQDFVHTLVVDWPAPACPDIFTEGLRHNPRQIKRTINVFLLLWQLAEARRNKLQGRIKPVRLAKIVVLQAAAPELYKKLQQDPGLLRELEIYTREEMSTQAPALQTSEEIEVSQPSPAVRRRTLAPEILALLEAYPEVKRILMLRVAMPEEADFGELKNDELRMYFTLTHRVDAPLTEAEDVVVRSKIEQELALAAQVQASFLPQAFPTIPGWQIAAALQPARQVSGDFYDVIPLPGERFGLVIADVADKGMPAALYMSLSRTLLRTYAVEYPDNPALVLQKANDRLLTDSSGSLFVTAVYGVLDPTKNQFTYCNAGHNPPLLVPQGRGETIMPLKKAEMALGIVESQTWTVHLLEIKPSETLVFYTDGLIEEFNAENETFGVERLQTALLESWTADAPALIERLLERVRVFIGESSQMDDLTLLVLKREAQDRGNAT